MSRQDFYEEKCPGKCQRKWKEAERARESLQSRMRVWLWVKGRGKKVGMKAPWTAELAKEISKESLARLRGSPWAKVTHSMSPISSRKEPAFAVLGHCLGAACGKGSRGARAVMNFDGCQSQQQLEALGQSHSQPVEDWNPSHGCHSVWFIQKLVGKTCCLYATDGNVFKILRKHLVGQILISNDYNFQNAGCHLCGWSHRRNSIWGMGWILFFCIRCEQFHKPQKGVWGLIMDPRLWIGAILENQGTVMFFSEPLLLLLLLCHDWNLFSH